MFCPAQSGLPASRGMHNGGSGETCEAQEATLALEKLGMSSLKAWLSQHHACQDRALFQKDITVAKRSGIPGSVASPHCNISTQASQSLGKRQQKLGEESKVHITAARKHTY